MHITKYLILLASIFSTSLGGLEKGTALDESFSISSTHLQFSGRCFQTRQYPDEKEVLRMPLSELLDIRPNKLDGAERDHFYHLFALHPDISKFNMSTLGEKGFIQGWLDLLFSITSTSRNDRKLPYCVNTYLQHFSGVPFEITDRITDLAAKRRMSDNQRNRRIQRIGSTDPKNLERKLKDANYQASYQAQYFKDRKHNMKKGAADFQAMLDDNGISAALPAEALELATRQFRETLGSAQMTTRKLRQFLYLRNDKESGLERVLRNRSMYNVKTQRQKSRLEEKAKRKGQASRNLGGILETRNSDDVSSEEMLSLVTRSTWWS